MITTTDDLSAAIDRLRAAYQEGRLSCAKMSMLMCGLYRAYSELVAEMRAIRKAN